MGSPIVHRGEYQGKPYEDKGEILRFDPGDSSSTAHSPASRTVPSITWQLSERDGGTELTITEHNLPSEQGKEVSEQRWVELQTGDDDHSHHIDPAQIVHYAMTRQ